MQHKNQENVHMTDNFSLVSAYPEIVLLVASCVIALVGLGGKSSTRT